MQAAPVSNSHSAAAAKAAIPYLWRPPRLRLRRGARQGVAASESEGPNPGAELRGRCFSTRCFPQMTNGLKGEGPFGNTVGTGIWRSMQIEQYSKSFAQGRRRRYRQKCLSHADHAAGEDRRPDPRTSRHEPASLTTAGSPHPRSRPPQRRAKPASSPKN